MGDVRRVVSFFVPDVEDHIDTLSEIAAGCFKFSGILDLHP
jgi:hypothetical protein